jgi:hypothetical protein
LESLTLQVSRLFYDNLFDLERDQDFINEIMNSKISRKIIHLFVYYLEKNSKKILDYKDIIFPLCNQLIKNHDKYEENYWIAPDLSKLIAGLYDEVVETDEQIAGECLDIWDLMFEYRIGSIRDLSKKILDR